jgi:hypothetical protein
LPELVRCAQHGPSLYCWKSRDGSHVDAKYCVCPPDSAMSKISDIRKALMCPVRDHVLQARARLKHAGIPEDLLVSLGVG